MPIQNMSNFQKHFGSYANLPLNPANVRFPDDSSEETPVDEQEVSTENNTDIEREERKFVSEQRHLIHSQISSAD